MQNQAQIEQPPDQETDEDPFALFGQWLEAARSSEPERPQRDGAGHGRARRATQRPRGAAEGLRRHRLRVLHEHPVPEGNRAGGQHAGSGRPALEVAAAPGALSGTGGDGLRSGGRCLLCISAAGQPHRGLGQPAVPPPLESRFALEKSVAGQAARFLVGEVPRPPHWTGYRISPTSIEFWTERPFRLHDRFVFRRQLPEAGWRVERLYP